MLRKLGSYGAVVSLGVALTPLCSAQATLKGLFAGRPYVGTAINENQIEGHDRRGDAIVASQFDSISPENALKWQNIHPEPGVYAFETPDQYVKFGEKHHMYIVGHTLVWHSQVPDWVFRDDKGNLVNRVTLLARMRDHIHTVVGRYKGRIQSWDVVNEVLNDDGTLRQSLWLQIIGEDYIAKAFEYAHEADPQAQLTYNDYSLEGEAKRKGAVALVKKLKAAGVPISNVGLQTHLALTSPSIATEEATISAFEALGVKVAITELDVDVLPRGEHQEGADISLRVEKNSALNPYAKGLPEPMQQSLAARYAELFQLFLKHRETVSRVTLWGVTDADSWLNDWPMRGRTSYPLLFDRAGKPKPAFFAIEAAGKESAK